MPTAATGNFAARKQMVAGTGKNCLPTTCNIPEFVEAAGLMPYGYRFVESFRRAAIYVEKFLKGAKPAETPGGTANKIRVRHQSQDGEADRRNDSAVGALPGR